MRLKHILLSVEIDRGNLEHGRPPMWILADPTLHIDAVGGGTSSKPTRGKKRLSIHLTDKRTGRPVEYEFDGEGANDPEPFLMVKGRSCDTSVILLTIEFPWRHSLQQYTRVMDTFAFRMSDLAYVDRTAGPVTEIALLGSSGIEADDTSMQPTIHVECIGDRGGSLYRFAMKI